MLGLESWLAISKQNSFGSPTTSWMYVPFVSEAITDDVDYLAEDAIRQVYDAGLSTAGAITAAGDVVFEAHPRTLGAFLRGALGISSTTAIVSGFVYSTTFTPAQSYTHGPRCPLPPYSVEISRGVGHGLTFSDCLIDTLTLNIEAQKIVTVTAGLLCRVASIHSNTPTTSFYSTQPWVWSSCSISIGGTANDAIQTLEVKIENSLEGVYTLDAQRWYNRFCRNDRRKIMLSGRMDYDVGSNMAVLKYAYQQGSAYAISVALLGATTISSGYYNSLIATFPTCRLTKFAANVGGPGRIEADFEFTCEYNVGSGLAASFVLQNAHIGGY